MTAEELSKKRLAICTACPLYKETMNGPVCNGKKFLNPETGELSYFPKDGFIRGCSCRLNHKTLNTSAKCPCKKW